MDDDESREMQIVFIAGGGLGILASLFIMVTYGRFRSLDKTNNKLVFYLSVCDFMFSSKCFLTGCLMGYVDQFSSTLQPLDITDPCFLIGAFGYFSAFSTTSWNAMITVRLLRSFHYSAPSKSDHNDVEWPYHVYVWGVVSLSTSILIYLRAFGRSYNGCWIAVDHLWDVFWLLPLSIYILSCTVIMITLHVKIGRSMKQTNARNDILLHVCIWMD
eukprot:TRINITY_DN7174_c0_g2_i2.p1 TRINITY_DN7174_c0_g2~~TRINITY_DN7174_c0_g2_i2.p1  ORF type:complete len:216 (+),score=34.95 TRINITY_DN7174_c0_g2_i2:15-662(+)